ncbi:hypothetical protein [Methylobacterium radiodurans]|uniref:hypothetical protein n=1 Tax=Methylobacterium radiodurans TaxID=2202828 RepID=UPI00194EAA5A|nr:hypothetical protein [Methylobacterium radiodurans]
MLWRRELHTSSSGDRWFLARDTAPDRPYILHEPDAASGGLPSQIEIGSFLVTGKEGPEHRELVRLIGTLAEGGVLVTPPVEQARSHWIPSHGLG